MNLDNLELGLLIRSTERNLGTIKLSKRIEFDQISRSGRRSPRAWLADWLLAAAIRLDRGAGGRAAERLPMQHA